MRVIQDLGLDNPTHLELDYSGSSINSLTTTLLQQLYAAGSGLEPSHPVPVHTVHAHVRVYYPSKRSVHASNGGVAAGSHFFLRERHWRSLACPRACVRQLEPLRRGLLSHQKLLFARGRRGDGSCFAWVYIGSANPTSAAWGRLTRHGISINNHECGIVACVPANQLRFADATPLPSIASFDQLLPVPFAYPGQLFSSHEPPWFFPI